MKLASFEHGGRQSYGVVESGKIIDLGPSMGSQYPDLHAVLSGDALGTLADAARAGGPGEYALDDVQLLPPIAKPDKIICVGLNYESHRKETGRPVVEHPTLFTRFANTQIGHGAPIHAPKESTSVDYEGELAVIIGKPGRHIAESAAMEHVAGYSCYNDVSIRDWQRHTSQFTPGKNFAATGPFGPWMVTSDEIPDPSTLTLETRLNGERMQHATTDLLIFTIPVLIRYISTFTRLEPGDVIVSGTPGGVGFKRDPQVFMKNGDRVEIEISGIGVLANPVIDAPD